MFESESSRSWFLQVITTERAGHARDIMSQATKDELNALDGVIVVVRCFLTLLR